MPRIAIVGATATGLYASDLLMRCATQIPGISPARKLHIDILDPAAAPLSVSTSAQVANASTPHSPQPVLATVRLLGNVQIGSNITNTGLNSAELPLLYDAVLYTQPSTNYTEQAISHEVAQLVYQLQAQEFHPVIDVANILAQRNVVHTTWENPLKLPTTWNLAQWEAAIHAAHGAPICF
ncbi:MAG: hypothetical protein Q3976_09065 [Corynebacterium sp.]|nr:hypothetical protein [Corynebacterium sp.]